MFLVYRIWHIATGKSYIGQTANYERRIREHFGSHTSSSRYLSYAIQKHGKDAFDHEILVDNIPKSDIDAVEKQLIEEWNTVAPNGYNLSVGGNSNRTMSDDTREKMSRSTKEYWDNNPQAKQEYSKKFSGSGNPMHGRENPGGMTGKTHSNETKLDISNKVKEYYKHNDNPMLDKKRPDLSERNRKRKGVWKHTPESRKKMSLSRLGKKRGKYKKKVHPDQLTLF